MLKRIVGAGAILVAIVGVGLSVAAVVEILDVAERVQDEVPDAIGQLTEIVQVLERQGDSIVASLNLAREHTKSVLVTVDELAGRERPLGPPRPAATGLEAELLQRLTNTEEFVASMQGTMRSMSGTLLVLDSMPFIAPRFAGDQKTPSQLRTMAANLSETADGLDLVAVTLSEMRSGRPLDEQQIAFLKDSLRSVDEQLAVARDEVTAFGERLERATETMESWQSGIEPTVARLRIASIAFFVCFACTQIALGLHGWRCLRGDHPAASDSPEAN